MWVAGKIGLVRFLVNTCHTWAPPIHWWI